MTMFYDARDIRWLEEKRAREIAVEEVGKLGSPDCQPGFIRTIDGHLVRLDEAMLGKPPC